MGPEQLCYIQQLHVSFETDHYQAMNTIFEKNVKKYSILHQLIYLLCHPIIAGAMTTGPQLFQCIFLFITLLVVVLSLLLVAVVVV